MCLFIWGQGMYIKNENNNRFINYTADEISDDLIRKIAAQINQIPVKIEKGKACAVPL